MSAFRQPSEQWYPPGPSTSTSSGIDTLREVNQRVDRAEVICRESEVIATETLGELAHQREALGRTRDRVAEANRELDATNKNLKQIHWRIASNKILLCSIILMEAVIIGLQLYLKFFKKWANKWRWLIVDKILLFVIRFWQATVIVILTGQKHPTSNNYPVSRSLSSWLIAVDLVRSLLSHKPTDSKWVRFDESPLSRLPVIFFPVSNWRIYVTRHCAYVEGLIWSEIRQVASAAILSNSRR